MSRDQIDYMINPPLIGIHEDNMKYRGPLILQPGTIYYAWPQFPFSIMTPRLRAIAAILPRRYRWMIFNAHPLR